jgi:hypothetical protein
MNSETLLTFPVLNASITSLAALMLFSSVGYIFCPDTLSVKGSIDNNAIINNDPR